MNKRCDRPATQVVRGEGREKATGLRREFAWPMCDEHYADFAHPCDREGCEDMATLVINVDGTSIESGKPRTRELRLCEACWELMQKAPAMTMNGVRMVHDGHGHMKALPDEPGRG